MKVALIAMVAVLFGGAGGFYWAWSFMKSDWDRMDLRLSALEKERGNWAGGTEKSSNENSALLGHWTVDPADKSRTYLTDVEFKPQGIGLAIMQLIPGAQPIKYRVVGDKLDFEIPGTTGSYTSRIVLLNAEVLILDQNLLNPDVKPIRYLRPGGK